MTTLDDYERGERIGAGGFADVYHAIHIPTRHALALKVAREDDESLARIRREIEVQRKLAHANIMQIVDWDRDRFTWFATEVAEGNLGELHERAPLNETRALRLLEELLAALGVAHRRGFIHRDLSPGNILRTQGRWVLADWGYVNDPDARTVERLTRTGTGGGTFTWAAPETLQDVHRADARSDLYALGKLVAWMLTGKVPGIGTAPELPEAPSWRTFLAKLTEKDPAERFQSAEEALAGLAAVVAATPATEEQDVEQSAQVVRAAPDVVPTLKRYLVDPQHKIRLFDLVTAMTAETMDRLSDKRFGPDVLDQGDALLERLQAYFECCRPLMHLLFTGGHFGEEAHESLWTTCIQRIADNEKRSAGYTKMIEVQRFPVFLVMSAGAFGSIVGGQYRNLAAMTERPLFRRSGEPEMPLVGRVTASSSADHDMLRATAKFKMRKTPASEVLFEYLRDLSRGVLLSDAEYEAAFDRFEVLMCLLAVDAGGWATGCFAWRGAIMGRPNDQGPMARVRREFEAAGTQWAPLKVGLMGGDPERVGKAFDQLASIAEGVARF
jgi:Protein kinase domain